MNALMEKLHFVQVEESDGIVTVRLNRPGTRNAFNPPLVVELCEVFQELRGQDDVRVVLLSGAGSTFCAGMDLKWVMTAQHHSEAQRLQTAEHIMAMYQTIFDCPVPLVGRIQGGAFGGGVGLVACCDVVVAAEDTQFAFREVRLGMVSAIIAPYILRKLGFSQASRYCLTGEGFSAAEAKRIGLVHEVVPAQDLDSRVQSLTQELLRIGPLAGRETKKLFRQLLELPEEEQGVWCAQTNARVCGTEEAQEGFQAFLEKRSPAWATEFPGGKATK